MPPGKTSRRELLQTGAGVAGLGVVTSLSGCFGLLGGESSETDENSVARDVPNRAGAMLSVNFDAIVDDSEIIDGTNVVLQRRNEAGGTGPASVDEALTALRDRYMLDPRKMNRTIAFVGGDIDEALADSSTPPYWGTLGYTDWASAEMVSSFADVSLEEVTERTHNGTTAYDNTKEWMAPLGEGNVALGSSQAVKDAIDIANGDREGVSGQLRSAFDSTDGEYARFAATLDLATLAEQQVGSRITDAVPLSSINYIAGSVFADGDERGLKLTARLSSGTDAEQLATTIDGFVGIAKAQGIQGSLLERYEGAIQNLETSSNGKTMTASYQTSSDDFNEQVGEAIADLLVTITP